METAIEEVDGSSGEEHAIEASEEMRWTGHIGTAPACMKTQMGIDIYIYIYMIYTYTQPK